MSLRPRPPARGASAAADVAGATDRFAKLLGYDGPIIETSVRAPSDGGKPVLTEAVDINSSDDDEPEGFLHPPARGHLADRRFRSIMNPRHLPGSPELEDKIRKLAEEMRVMYSKDESHFNPSRVRRYADDAKLEELRKLYEEMVDLADEFDDHLAIKAFYNELGLHNYGIKPRH